MNAPDVSVVMPVYNAASFLAESVDSVLSQDGVSLELILVNDGSTDGSGEMCDAYGQRDSRIRVVHQSNAGVSHARNQALSKATGEFVLFADADDFLEPDALAVMMAEQKKTGADFIRANYRMFFDKSIPSSFCGGLDHFAPPEKWFAYVDKTEAEPRVRFYGGVWGLLLRLDVIKRNALSFREDLLVGEDWRFILELAELSGKYRYMEQPLYNYRRQTINSLTTTFSPTKVRRSHEAVTRFAALRRYLGRENTEAELDKALGDLQVNFYIRYLVACAADSLVGDLPESRRRFREAFLSPELLRLLPYYRPKAGQGKSRVLPWLIRCRLQRTAFHLCRFKAKKRYARELALHRGEKEEQS